MAEKGDGRADRCVYVYCISRSTYLELSVLSVLTVTGVPLSEPARP